jgi:hypothetical protein
MFFESIFRNEGLGVDLVKFEVRVFFKEKGSTMGALY